MAARPVELKRLVNGKAITTVDPLGGVFATVPGKGLRPVYALAPKDHQGTADVMFTCPVSAIPSGVWDLLHLWHGCRLMGLPPVAGGFLDQPVAVQMAFPVFESLQQSVDQAKGAAAPERAAGMAVAAMVRAMSGGR